jgi:hypothetical protein
MRKLKTEKDVDTPVLKSGAAFAETTKRKTQMKTKLLTWKKQKELIRFFVDGSGTIQPTSDEEANFSNDLLFLILGSCKDEENFKRTIKKFTKARAHELSNEPLSKSEVRRIRQRLAAE